MSTSEKDIRKREDEHRKLLFDANNKIISKISQIITHIGEMGKYADIDTDIPNMGITFNNKLNELSDEFRNAGISLFAELNEKYDYIGSNFVGDAIIEDMTSQLKEGTQALSMYNYSMGEATKRRTEKIQALEKSGTMRKFFLKIRSFFVPNNISNLTSYSEEEIREVNSHLLEYKQVDENLWKYNLKDNVVQSILKYLNDKRYSDDNIPGLLEEDVIPTLKKIGLEDLIPKLQEEISKSQQQEVSKFEEVSSNSKSWELSNWGIDKKQFMQENASNMEEYSENTHEQQTIEVPAQEERGTMNIGYEDGYSR